MAARFMRGIGVVAVGVHRVVAEVLPGAAMQLVGAGFDRHIDNAAAGIAVLGA